MMSDDLTDSRALQPDELQLDQLQAQLVLLMNHYAMEADAQVARAIKDTMLGILRHPLIDLFPDFRAQCARALNHWRARSAFAATPDACIGSVH